MEQKHVELKEKIEKITERYENTKDNLFSEEATKNSLILPLIAALGYDIHNVLEVIPEYGVEIPGTKKGDKVDYAIKIEIDQSIILIECKSHDISLDLTHESQLIRYFNAVPNKKKIAILTNGLQYQFYLDFDVTDKTGPKSYLSFDIRSMDDIAIKSLFKHAREVFEYDVIKPQAKEYKLVNAMKTYLLTMLNDPDDEFVKLVTPKKGDERMTPKRILESKTLVKEAFTQLINDQVKERVKSIQIQEKAASKIQENESSEMNDSKQDGSQNISQDGFDAYCIIKSILRKDIDPNRITLTKNTHFYVIRLDDNQRKLVCRLHFNDSDNKSIGIRDSTNRDAKYPLKDLNEIYNLSEDLFRVCVEIDKGYEKTQSQEK